MSQFEHTIRYKKLSIDEISSTLKELCDAAKEATELAYAPYSEFYVGAAALLENNLIIPAANLENAAYPQCMCAEAVLLGSIHSQHPTQKIVSIAITVATERLQSQIIAPCGKCRQQLFEAERRQNANIQICLVGKNEVYIFDDTKSLLPFGFVL